MDQKSQIVLDRLLNLSSRVVEVSVAHSKMTQALLEALAETASGDDRLKKKMRRVINAHRRLAHKIDDLPLQMVRVADAIEEKFVESNRH